MRIIYNNIINNVSAGSIVASSETINYEVSHIQDDRLSYNWKSDSATAQTIIFDLGSALEVNTLSLIGHNIIDGTIITFEANATDSWGAPSVSQALTWNENAILYFFSAMQEYRYWRLVLTGQGDIEIGKIVIGTYIQINPSSLLNFKVTEMNDDIRLYNKDRQRISLRGDKWRKVELDFPKTAYSTINLIETMFDTVGNFRSIVFCNFDTIRDYQIVEPLYCSIVGDLTFNHVDNMAFSYSLVLEEDL